MLFRKNFESSVVTAIQGRKMLQINYKGSGWRTICPHILFVGPSGNKLMEAYQVSGYSSHRWNASPSPEWRTFSVDYITDLRPLDGTFNIAPGYDPTNGYKYPRVVEKV